MNKKIKILEIEIVQYRDKIKNLEAQLNNKKFSGLPNKNHINSHKINVNMNEGNDISKNLNEDNNEKNYMSVINGIFFFMNRETWFWDN